MTFIRLISRLFRYFDEQKGTEETIVNIDLTTGTFSNVSKKFVEFLEHMGYANNLFATFD